MFTNTLTKRICAGLNIGHWQDNDNLLNEMRLLEVM